MATRGEQYFLSYCYDSFQTIGFHVLLMFCVGMTCVSDLSFRFQFKFKRHNGERGDTQGEEVGGHCYFSACPPLPLLTLTLPVQNRTNHITQNLLLIYNS